MKVCCAATPQAR